jgi:hypothetical protein
MVTQDRTIVRNSRRGNHLGQQSFMTALKGRTYGRKRSGQNIRSTWGLEPLDALARHDLLEILEERYGRRSTLITSQLPVASWHEVIGDPTYADAILDRLVHNAHRLNLEGDSLRRLKTDPGA